MSRLAVDWSEWASRCAERRDPEPQTRVRHEWRDRELVRVDASTGAELSADVVPFARRQSR